MSAFDFLFVVTISMSCLLFFSRVKKNIVVNYCVPSLDKKYSMPVVETTFFGYYETSVCLWSKITRIMRRSFLFFSTKYGINHRTWKHKFLFWKCCCPFQVNYLDNNSGQANHAYSFKTYKSHQERCTCHCFKCRNFELLLEVAAGRNKGSTFLLKPKDTAKICFVRSNIQHFGNREHINFRSHKLVSNQDPDAFKSISQATNIDSYFSLSLLLVGNTLFSCKKEF